MTKEELMVEVQKFAKASVRAYTAKAKAVRNGDSRYSITQRIKEAREQVNRLIDGYDGELMTAFDKRISELLSLQADLTAMVRRLAHRLPEGDDMRAKATEWLTRVGLIGEVLRTSPGVETPASPWILASSGKLPVVKTPVLMRLCNGGAVHVAVLLWEQPGHEDTWQAYSYWDSPYDDGQDWEWGAELAWMPIPE